MKDIDELMRHVTGILLAGGESSRMGRDKALLPLRGRPLWEQVQATLAATGCARVLVSGANVGGIADVQPGLGPLAGIASVIGNQGDALSKDWLLVVPVDLPLLTPEALRLLCVRGFDAPAAHFADHALPALFVNSIGFRQALGSTLRAERARERSVTALHAALGARAVALPTELAATLTNTNTPADWAATTGTEPA